MTHTNETTIEIEQLDESKIAFYISYERPEELDEDGEGDWGHIANIALYVLKECVRVEGGNIVIDEIDSKKVQDAYFFNTVTDETSYDSADSFEEYEIMDMLYYHLTDENLEYLESIT